VIWNVDRHPTKSTSHDDAKPSSNTNGIRQSLGAPSRLDRRTFTLGTVLSLTSVPASALADNDPGASRVFEIVPLSDPAYAQCHLLETAYSMRTGFPHGWFDRSREVNRFEFTIAIEPMLVDVKIWIADVHGSKPPRVIPMGGAPPTPAVDFTELRRVFKDQRRLEQLLTGLRSLVWDFAPELRLLSEDIERWDRDLRQWKREAGSTARSARLLSGARDPSRDPTP
jgi:hypothetical protein